MSDNFLRVAKDYGATTDEGESRVTFTRQQFDACMLQVQRDAMPTQTPAFSLLQRVTIKDINASGMIISIVQTTDGMQYEVAYWNEGVRLTEMLLAAELVGVKSPLKAV